MSTVFVKICGITTEEDALLAVAMGADAVGFVFAPSPRQVTPDYVRDITHRLPHDTLTVGVFRDERPERVVEIMNRIGLKAAQLHGNESLSVATFVRSRVPFVIRGLPAGTPSLKEWAKSPIDVLLLDGPTPGSGAIFDWSLVEGAPDGVRLMLAGGLDPDNVAQAIRTARPWGVDTSSGVELEPGRKDATKVRRFIEAAKQAGEELAEDGWSSKDASDDNRPYDWQEDEA